MIGALRVRLNHRRLMRICRRVWVRRSAVIMRRSDRVEFGIQLLDLILQAMNGVAHGAIFAVYSISRKTTRMDH